VAALTAAAPTPTTTARPLIFIHMSKTGGTSIEETLGIENVYANATAECRGIPFMEKRFSKHATAAQAKNYYTDEEWQAAYKFSIVRNPWDRMVSWWAHQTTVTVHGPSGCLQACQCIGIKNTTMDSQRKSPAGVLQPADESITESSIPSDPSVGAEDYYCSFSHFLGSCVSQHEMTIKDGLDVFKVKDWWNDGSSGDLCEFAVSEGISVGSSLISQLEYIENNASRIARATKLDDATSLLDFVGRTESLQAHFEEAMVAAGNNRSHAAACAGSLLDIDEGSAGHNYYAEYYHAGNVKSKAAEIFRIDAAAFGYDYMNPGPFTAVYVRGVHEPL